MSKRPEFGSQFEKLRALGAQKPLDERKQPLETRSPAAAPEGGLTSLSSILGQSLSNANSVLVEQSHTSTVPASNSVQIEQSQSPSESDATVSKSEAVQAEPCEKRTVSAADTVTEGFTRVQHSLLRGEAKFDEPLDFMVYMHLFTYSYGFNRREAHMSQAQLERFTGAAKNTVKRSLERLAAQKWIKCIEEYECARMSRKWRVFSPEERDGGRGPGGKRTASKLITVRDEPGSVRTVGLSESDTQTVSTVAPFKERDPKEKSKNSLSAKPSAIREYLDAVKPVAKQGSERRAYQGLKRDYGEEQIASCLDFLLTHGIPVSGAPCHSPMGFLSKAFGQVWATVEIEQRRRVREEEQRRRDEEVQAGLRKEREQAERDAHARESAFVREFPDPKTQAKVLSQFADAFPLLSKNGPALRGLTIAAWWNRERQGVA